ncbi:hypothetical protein AHAS_Ahas16G0110300 [Arachis hypogaea]
MVAVANPSDGDHPGDIDGRSSNGDGGRARRRQRETTPFPLLLNRVFSLSIFASLLLGRPSLSLFLGLDGDGGPYPAGAVRSLLSLSRVLPIPHSPSLISSFSFSDFLFLQC